AETRSLLAVARDESARIRLRGLLRTIITGVHVLVIPRRSQRLAAVQVHFVAGTRRDYLILYKPAGNGRKGGWWCRSLAAVTKTGDIDLRKRGDARKLEAVLLAMNTDKLG